METPTILAGGRMVSVTYIDGTKADVKVRQLPIRLLTDLDARQTDEPALVELYCEKEKGWADTITHESYEEIVNLGDELNRGPFERFRERLKSRLGMVRKSHDAMVEAGILPARRAQGELLVMPEVRPAVTAPVPAPAGPVATETLPQSPSTQSSELSAPAESSHPENEH